MWKPALLWLRLRKELLLARALLRDPRTPAATKIVVLLAALYVANPIDLVSDFIPVLGWLDDGLVAWLLLRVAQRLVPPELLAALRARINARAGPAAR